MKKKKKTQRKTVSNRIAFDWVEVSGFRSTGVQYAVMCQRASSTVAVVVGIWNDRPCFPHGSFAMWKIHRSNGQAHRCGCAQCPLWFEFEREKKLSNNNNGEKSNHVIRNSVTRGIVHNKAAKWKTTIKNHNNHQLYPGPRYLFRCPLRLRNAERVTVCVCLCAYVCMCVILCARYSMWVCVCVHRERLMRGNSTARKTAQMHNIDSNDFFPFIQTSPGTEYQWHLIDDRINEQAAQTTNRAKKRPNEQKKKTINFLLFTSVMSV